MACCHESMDLELPIAGNFEILGTGPYDVLSHDIEYTKENAYFGNHHLLLQIISHEEVHLL